ncbi:hypothetical protein CBR_g11909 [Chara braunii]|uniref:Uncharacterized protein n=1 Tax=Chara braunii TaxID=69332 RepID=A0A388KQH7_CHABU|nr:hypothetical protein CBR_g11909 [Chara braunii]|eukprot:GBG72330.1 hypothetical protein CBR_g11909 [Chara braunii]
MDFDIRHRKHERHGNADGLTRLHRPEKVPKNEEVIPWNEPKKENGPRYDQVEILSKEESAGSSIGGDGSGSSASDSRNEPRYHGRGFQRRHQYDQPTVAYRDLDLAARVDGAGVQRGEMATTGAKGNGSWEEYRPEAERQEGGTMEVVGNRMPSQGKERMKNVPLDDPRVQGAAGTWQGDKWAWANHFSSGTMEDLGIIGAGGTEQGEPGISQIILAESSSVRGTDIRVVPTIVSHMNTQVEERVLSEGSDVAAKERRQRGAVEGGQPLRIDRYRIEAHWAICR